MRPSLRLTSLLAVALAAQLVQAGLFGSSDSTSSADASSSTSTSTSASSSTSSSSSSSSSTTNSNGTSSSTPAEVVFLQTLQTADISSMSCLITLVNMTYQTVGTCLGLTTLTTLIVSPEQNSSFSDQVTSYISGICGSAQCNQQDIADSLSLIDANCQNSINTNLIQVLQAVLTRYSSAYYTLACKVHFNGTTPACLPDTLNSSQSANNNGFFNDLVAGTDLTQYQDSVFTSAPCTGWSIQSLMFAEINSQKHSALISKTTVQPNSILVQAEVGEMY
ncbi:hypothetical protein BCR39DRAFT_32614 [Naematelia encephala]|uniref:Uncharacterized protein n=1 Tax=Naematelia encephala TaxID=71784 RepID=A0A1Y2BM01_9TREE|nr:hypothetical protein BCR39DRAFT_32614 [Naematelia encephala]